MNKSLTGDPLACLLARIELPMKTIKAKLYAFDPNLGLFYEIKAAFSCPIQGSILGIFPRF